MLPTNSYKERFMSKHVVHVVGTGTIGEPLVGLLTDFRKDLGIDEVTFSKKQALMHDRSKVWALLKRGAKFACDPEMIESFKEIGVETNYTFDEALAQASVVIDCTPVGNRMKDELYKKYESTTRGFIAQGSEFGFGKPYARGINDEALTPDDQYIQVVSCNTHNLSVLIKTLGLDGGKDPQGLKESHFVCCRRANDISQDSGFCPGPSVNAHKYERFGTHHARDAHKLFETLGVDVNVFSSAMKFNSQYMHTIWFHIVRNRPITKDEVIERLKADDRIALTHKTSSNKVFSFGRDHGHFGRILNQTVVVESSLEVINDREILGWCFTPQDGNSLLSSLAATEFFLHGNEYDHNIQCLGRYFFNEV